LQHVIAIRRAVRGEASALTALAIRSKAHWGYDASFMQRVTADLEITPQLVDASAVFVAEDGSAVVGFYVLAVVDGMPMLLDLWIDPVAIGDGIGKQLWLHMLEEARRLGYPTIRIQSEPNAEGFYAKMGARRIGVAESTAMPGRMLPLMEIAT
jgi:GNAT superfamily N-acetyltransferase